MTCQAITRNGEPCRAAATKGSNFCFFHGQPDEAARLGRIGGRKNRRAVGWSAYLFTELRSAKDVRVACGRLADEVHSGKTDPKKAMAIRGLLRLQLEAAENEQYEERLTAMEKQLRIIRLREALTPSKKDTAVGTTDDLQDDDPDDDSNIN